MVQSKLKMKQSQILKITFLDASFIAFAGPLFDILAKGRILLIDEVVESRFMLRPTHGN